MRATIVRLVASCISSAETMATPNTFFATRVFGPDRTAFLQSALTTVDSSAATDREQQVAAARHALAELDKRNSNLLRTLELAAERAAVQDRLDFLETAAVEVQNPALLDALPLRSIKLSQGRRISGHRWATVGR